MSDELPAAWRRHTERKGISSYRRLGAAANIAHETARRVVRGASVKDDSIRRVADALGIDVEEVYALRNESAPDFSREWTPPASSAALTHEEREALARIISLMTAGRTEESDPSGHTTPTNPGADDAPVIDVVIAKSVVAPLEPGPRSAERPRHENGRTSRP